MPPSWFHLVTSGRVCKSALLSCTSAALLHVDAGSCMETVMLVANESDPSTSASALQLPPNIPPFEHYDKRKCCGGPQDGLKWMLKMQVRLRSLLPSAQLNALHRHLSSCTPGKAQSS